MSRVVLSIILICVWLVGHLALPAQAASTDNLLLKNLNVTDGLNQSTVHTIMQDSNGFMWFGTENGVNVYDGYSMRSLPGPDGDFASYITYHIREDKLGRVWLSLEGKGTYFYDTHHNSYQLIFSSDSGSNYVIGTVTNELGKSDWIATDKTVLLYEHDSQTTSLVIDLRAYLLGFDAIYSIKKLDHYLFIATRNGVFVYDIVAKQLRHLNFLKNKHFKQAKFDLAEANKSYDFALWQDTVFIGTNDGVFSLSLTELAKNFNAIESLTIEQVVANEGIWSLYSDNDGLYIGSYNGFYKLAYPDFTLQKVLSFSDFNKHIAQNQVLSIEKDSHGMFWLGAQASGVYQWNPNSQLIWNLGFDNSDVKYSAAAESATSLSSSGVYALAQNSRDQAHIWVATSNGLNKVNTKTNTVEHFLVQDQSRTTFTASNIYQLLETEQHLWLGTYQGIQLFDKATKQLIELPFSEEVNQWLQQEHYTFAVAHGFLWFFGERGAAKVSLTSGQLTQLPTINQAVINNSIWQVFTNFTLWPNKLVITTNDNIWLYDIGQDTIALLHQFEEKSEAEYFSIDSMLVDKNNILWIAYGGIGLYGFDVANSDTGSRLIERFFYHKDNVGIDNNVYGLQADQQGNLWFSSHHGVYRLDINNHHIRNFNADYGFASNEFNTGAFLPLADGRLAYGSMFGISVFDPIALHNMTKNNEFNIHFSNLATLSRSLDPPMFIPDGYEFELNYDDVGVRIDFSTLMYISDTSVEYSYRLRGPINIDAPLSPQNYITFPQLASGKYQLSVQAKSPYTGELSAPRTIYFNVSYAPWRSPTALFIYAGVIIALASLWLWRRYLNRQALLAAHEEVKFRENRLQLALTGSNSDVWDWLSSDNHIYANRFVAELGYPEQDKSIAFDRHIELIHPEDRALFIAKWQSFLMNAGSDESFECVYRLQHFDGHWQWYKDLGKVVAFDTTGKANRVTGSYTNITQRKLEDDRAKQFGDAFKRTQDWVFIINEEYSWVTANQSLCNVFGWKNNEFMFDPHILGMSKSRIKYYLNLLPQLKESGHYRGEELIQTPLGEEFHVVMNISASHSADNNSYHYIFVMTDISAQKKAEQELRQLANYDHLTGLPNRSLLLERIKHGIEQAKRTQRAIALFFIDLDRFKQVNDSLGHDSGDFLLKEISQRLTVALREDDTLARIGGDEFVILLEHFRSNNELSRIAQKVIQVIEQPVLIKGTPASVGASVGIAIYPEDSGSKVNYCVMLMLLCTMPNNKGVITSNSLQNI